jgi:hypothetical protein
MKSMASTSGPDGESIVEHITSVEDYQVALATYRAACERWPAPPNRGANGGHAEVSNPDCQISRILACFVPHVAPHQPRQVGRESKNGL